MQCGLEFWPPSETWQSASTLTIAERVADLRENWRSEPSEPELSPQERQSEYEAWLASRYPKPGSSAIVLLPVSASHIEKQFWDAHTRLSLPELDGLVFQHPVGRFRLDFALPEHKFGIELDGFLSHSSTQNIEKDRVRQRWLQEQDWYITRYGGREVYRDAEWAVRDAARSARRLIAP